MNPNDPSLNPERIQVPPACDPDDAPLAFAHWRWCRRPGCDVKWWGEDTCWNCGQPSGSTRGAMAPYTVDAASTTHRTAEEPT